MRVVDHAEQRLIGGCLGEQTQHRHRQGRRAGRGTRAEAERRGQRLTMRPGQPVVVLPQRRAQHLQRRPGDPGLQLHTGDPEDPAAGGLPREVVEQRRLAGARVTAQHQHPAVTSGDVSQHP